EDLQAGAGGREPGAQALEEREHTAALPRVRRVYPSVAHGPAGRHNRGAVTRYSSRKLTYCSLPACGGGSSGPLPPWGGGLGWGGSTIRCPPQVKYPPP